MNRNPSLKRKTPEIKIADIANNATYELIDLLNERVGDPADVRRIRINQIQTTIKAACVKAVEVCAEGVFR